MIDTIFSSTVRKYNIDDPLIKGWASEQYEKEKFNVASPFRLEMTDIPTNLAANYTDVTERLLEDLKISDTHAAFITNMILSVLEKGDSMDRCNTLPSHYTATHYISGNDADVFYHPARSLLTLCTPGLDEWSSATSLYVNAGDVIVHPSYLEYNTPPVKQQRVAVTVLISLQEKE